MDFLSKKYVVTGATSGIGFGASLELLRKGATVFGIGRDESKVKTLLKEFPASFYFISVNLEKIDTIKSVFQSIPEKLDGLILCAGVEISMPLKMHVPEKVNTIFNINVLSNVELIRMFSSKRISNDNSSIVVVASVMAALSNIGLTGYSSSKAAILGLVRSSALELASRGIRVNAVSPGFVKTPLTHNFFDKLDENRITEIERMHPLGFGEVEDIVPLLIFLLSDGSKWLTGQNIIIDEGYSIR